MQEEVRRETVDDILAQLVLPLCLRQEMNPHPAIKSVRRESVDDVIDRLVPPLSLRHQVKTHGAIKAVKQDRGDVSL